LSCFGVHNHPLLQNDVLLEGLISLDSMLKLLEELKSSHQAGRQSVSNAKVDL
jgi:hypothetical protein